MRAEFLGAAGPTDLVRCACGKKLYLSRRHWARRGFTVCDDCKSVIRYGSLAMVGAQEAEDFFTRIIRQGEERDALKEDLERELRRFVSVYDRQPEWLWSPATVKFVQTVRPKLELLGGPVGLTQNDDVDVYPEAAYKADDEELLVEES